MLTYEPGGSFAHRLDPRAKLGFQFAFAAAAFAHTTPRGLVALTALVAVVAWTAALPLRETLVEYRFVAPFLVVGPVLESLTLGPPWVVPGDAVAPLLASYRVVLLLVVSAAYVRTTTVRESRAAIQHVVPGRFGQFLGLGVGFVFRFFPVLRRDLRSVRDAMAARLGDERPVRERMRIVGVSGLARAFERADRFSLALRARCFAWNPTLPPLRLTRADAPLLALTVGLSAWALV